MERDREGMTRRAALAVGLVLAGTAVKAPAQSTGEIFTGHMKDFDFLAGRWNVTHRRLKKSATMGDSWAECPGTCVCRPLFGGWANMEEHAIQTPGNPYPALGVRAFDPKSRQWSIWWLDARYPEVGMGTPVRGGFKDGLGTFVAQEEIDGKPILSRFLWSDITERSARWAQASSIDNGATWETNWTMDFARV